MATYTLAKNGESVFHIVNHRYSDETVRFAASELQKYILKATNTVIPYFSDDARCPRRGPEILIGPFVRGETEWEKDLHEEGFVIRSQGENIAITGKTSRGVLYGVYRFLEIFCNYRCFTKDVETIDKMKELTIELDEIREEPSFNFRDAYFRNAFEGGFASKNHLNSSLSDISNGRGGRRKWFNFHHSFLNLIPDEVYFEKHPEWYSEINGERKPNTQLCLTNEELVDEAEKNLRKWIENNPECKVFSVAQNDNEDFCTCEKCRKLEETEGSHSGPIIHFVNKLADRIKDDYPDVMIHTFAYWYSMEAPKYVVARDNVIVRLCTTSCCHHKPFEELASIKPGGIEYRYVNALKNWKNHAKNVYIWDYIVNFRNYLQPFVTFETLQKNLTFYKECGVLGVLEQGNFAYGGGGCFDDMKSYIISRLLWNYKTDIHDEIHRFCMGVYGEKAGRYMEEYTYLAQALCAGGELSIYQAPDAEYITDEYVEKADRLVSKAIAEAETEIYRRNAEKEYLSVRFLKLTRMELGTPGREEAIEKFFEDVKGHGITEIRERRTLEVTKYNMIKNRYAKGGEGEYTLYYIMQ